jgi:hypothetical protein
VPVGNSAYKGGKDMRKGALVVAGTISFALFILAFSSCIDAQTNPKATGGQDASSKAAAAIALESKNNNLDLSTISKAISAEATGLKTDAVGWIQKLQQLELDLNKNLQDDQATARDLEGSLVVLRAAAGRLGPDAEARATLRKEEAAVRELASRAEVHSQPEIRKSAAYFQQKTADLRALARSVEETRIQLITQIDRLEELKAQIEFRGAGQIGESIKRGQDTLGSVQGIVDNAQRLADDLNRFGRTPAAEVKPAAAQAINPPAAAAAKPPDGPSPAQAAKRR